MYHKKLPDKITVEVINLKLEQLLIFQCLIIIVCKIHFSNFLNMVCFCLLKTSVIRFARINFVSKPIEVITVIYSNVFKNTSG